MAAIPGWTATWDPQDGPSVTLAVAVDGLVQAVDVPPGLGTLVFSYNPPGFTAGFAASLAAASIIVAGPAVLIYVLTQRSFFSGLLQGAVK